MIAEPTLDRRPVAMTSCDVCRRRIIAYAAPLELTTQGARTVVLRWGPGEAECCGVVHVVAWQEEGHHYAVAGEDMDDEDITQVGVARV